MPLQDRVCLTSKVFALPSTNVNAAEKPRDVTKFMEKHSVSKQFIIIWCKRTACVTLKQKLFWSAKTEVRMKERLHKEFEATLKICVQ